MFSPPTGLFSRRSASACCLFESRRSCVETTTRQRAREHDGAQIISSPGPARTRKIWIARMYYSPRGRLCRRDVINVEQAWLEQLPTTSRTGAASGGLQPRSGSGAIRASKTAKTRDDSRVSRFAPGVGNVAFNNDLVGRPWSRWRSYIKQRCWRILLGVPPAWKITLLPDRRGE